MTTLVVVIQLNATAKLDHLDGRSHLTTPVVEISRPMPRRRKISDVYPILYLLNHMTNVQIRFIEAKKRRAIRKSKESARDLLFVRKSGAAIA